MFIRSALAAAALIAGIATPASAVTNLIVNGSFEASSTFTGWTGTSTGRNGFAASSINTKLAYVNGGLQSAALRTTGKKINTLSQNVATIVARPYELTYWLMNRDNNGRVIDSMTVTSGAVSTVYGDRPSFGFTKFTQYFVATSLTSAISFTYMHTSPNFYLDNVVVTMVPEPAAWGLMVAGFGMVGFAARRRFRGVAA